MLAKSENGLLKKYSESYQIRINSIRGEALFSRISLLGYGALERGTGQPNSERRFFHDES